MVLSILCVRFFPRGARKKPNTNNKYSDAEGKKADRVTRVIEAQILRSTRGHAQDDILLAFSADVYVGLHQKLLTILQ